MPQTGRFARNGTNRPVQDNGKTSKTEQQVENEQMVETESAMKSTNKKDIPVEPETKAKMRG